VVFWLKWQSHHQKLVYPVVKVAKALQTLIFCGYSSKCVALTSFPVVTAAKALQNIPSLQLQWQTCHENYLPCGYSGKRIA